MLCAHSIRFRFDRDILGGLFFVNFAGEDWSEVRFTIAPTVAECVDVIDIPFLSGHDLSAGAMADAAMLQEDAIFHPVGDWAVISCADPLADFPHIFIDL